MTGTIQHGQQGKQGQQGWQGQPKENGRQGAETKEQAVIRVLTPYFLAYSSSKADLVTLRIYGRALAGMNLELLEAAMAKLLRTQKFWPSVAEICDAAREISDFVAVQSGQGERRLTSAEAWQEVMDNVKDRHLYKPWVFSCPEVERTARQFGIAELCSLEIRDVNTARAQFMRMYDSAVQQAKKERENREALGMLGQKKMAALLAAMNIKQIE